MRMCDCEHPCFVHCIWCGADCDKPWDAVHDASCPQATGMFPADPDDRCVRCGQEMETYMQRPTKHDDVVECVCVGCVAQECLI